MKQSKLILLAALLFLLPAALSCNKRQPAEVVLPEPATKAAAVGIAFDLGEPLVLELPERARPSDPGSAADGPAVRMKAASVDLSESSRYVIRFEEASTRAVTGKPVVWTGRYTLRGKAYLLDGIGELELLPADSQVKYRPADGVEVCVKGGAEYTVGATITPFPPLEGAASNLARNWTVDDTYVIIERTKDQTTLSKSFEGCDLQQIARYFSANGAGITEGDIDELEGYSVTEIYFEGNETIVINFSAAAPYHGRWNVSDSTFHWELEDGNRLLAAKADGTVAFPDTGHALLKVGADVSYGDETYRVTTEFTLSRAD